MGLRSRIRYYRKKHKVFLTHLVLLEGNIREECKREDGVGEVKVDRNRQTESVGPSRDLVWLSDANGGPFSKEGRSPRKESMSKISFFD